MPTRAALVLALAAAALPAAAGEPPAVPPPAPPEAPIAREVALPGGSFRLGERIGPLSDTVAYVRVGPFSIDETEVTVSAYAACVRARRCTPAAATVRWEGMKPADRAPWSALCNGDRAGRGDHPVNCVDWFQARDYCAFAGKRLPTEEEWEWAARNGTAGTTFPWGDAPPGDRPCWSGGPAGPRSGTCPVGSHPGADGAAGVKDLAGDVWEWTATGDVVFADSRGRGGTPVKIARGGGWGDSDPARLAAARRAKDLPRDRAADLGFRCARSR